MNSTQVERFLAALVKIEEGQSTAIPMLLAFWFKHGSKMRHTRSCRGVSKRINALLTGDVSFVKLANKVRKQYDSSSSIKAVSESFKALVIPTVIDDVQQPQWLYRNWYEQAKRDGVQVDRHTYQMIAPNGDLVEYNYYHGLNEYTMHIVEQAPHNNTVEVMQGRV